MTNLEKLKNLVIDVFLIDPTEFRLDLRRDQVDTWDSLGVVSLAVGVEETFGYHLTQDEALSVKSVSDVARILGRHGIAFDGA
jgi:acyl carrier protein